MFSFPFSPLALLFGSKVKVSSKTCQIAFIVINGIELKSEVALFYS